MPAASPATQAPMKPLPSTSTADAYASTAIASSASGLHVAPIQPRSRAASTSRPPSQPVSPPSNAESTNARRKVSTMWGSVPPVASCVRPMKMITNGRAMPSFRPLSTFRPSRTGCGTLRSTITDWAREASVGARTAPTRAASQMSRPANMRAASAQPSPIVSGSPMASSRDGSERSRTSRAASISNASLNRTRIRVSSKTRSASVTSEAGETRPRPTGPTSSPSATKTIGAVMIVVRRRSETRL